MWYRIRSNIDIRTYIRYPARYLARYQVSGRLFVQLHGIRLNICQDIIDPVGYFARYPVSSRTVNFAVHPVNS